MTSITHNLLKLIISDQREERVIPTDYIKRESEAKLQQLSQNKEIIVLTGLRRCGKSVLLHYIRSQYKQSDYYFNFEDERLATFTTDDFQTLYEVFIELFGKQNTFFFDEIQNIQGWEMFVRRLYNAGHKIYITGSNANLFSEELGTRLTGRYITIHIYPISFYEYLQHQDSNLVDIKLLSTSKVGMIKNQFNNYSKLGGIPEYIKHQLNEYLNSLYESIIYRDIIARYKVSSDTNIKKLVFYLASNCSKEMTYTSLRKLLGMGSTTTISDYCHYLENSYLCFFLNRYSESVKSQILSPKKVYFIDPILAKVLGFRFSEDWGRMLENLVFLELKRRNFELFYFKGIQKCDFIVRKNAQTVELIQVSKSLSQKETKRREINGLIEAMKRFKLKSGLIITEHEEQRESFQSEGIDYQINIVPIWKWLISPSQKT